MLICFTVFFINSDNYMTGFSAFDWYLSGKEGYYIVVNSSTWHILEVIILGVLAYLHRYVSYSYA